MSAPTVQVTKTYVVCPHCGENSGGAIDHLIADHREMSWGPWYCGHCKRGFAGTVTADGDVSVKKVDSSFTKCFDLVCLPPQKHPVYFILSTAHPTDSEPESTKFFYESHSCPTNWLRDIEMISIEGDQDPHGLIEYIGSAPFDQSVADDCNHDWSETFPVIGTESSADQLSDSQ